jgi:chromate reductase, NAD(P)H dehydrogenase (quinone)
MKIITISGSLRKDSYNSALARALTQLAPADMLIEHAEIGDLPLYNSDLEATFPSEATTLKQKITAADGVIFVTPEYNRSIPGVLKNAIDWASRPYGTSAWTGKVALIMGVSVGKTGTAIGQSHLKVILLHLNMEVMGQPEVFLGPSSEIFDAANALSDAKTKELLSTALTALAQKVNRPKNG